MNKLIHILSVELVICLRNLFYCMFAFLKFLFWFMSLREREVIAVVCCCWCCCCLLLLLLLCLADVSLCEIRNMCQFITYWHRDIMQLSYYQINFQENRKTCKWMWIPNPKCTFCLKPKTHSYQTDSQKMQNVQEYFFFKEKRSVLVPYAF